MVVTYAGYEDESDLLWDVYIRGVDADEHPEGKGHKIEGMEDLPCYANEAALQFTYWDHENQMPWQTEKYLNKQFDTLRPATYMRLHENRWVSQKEAFMPIEWHDRSVLLAKQMGMKQDAILWRKHPYANWPIWAGVDASTKRDSTAVSFGTYDSSKGIYIRMGHFIWIPQEGEMFDIEEAVGGALLEINDLFNIQEVLYDPTQMHQVALNLLRKGIPMEEFPQTTPNMTKASQDYYDIYNKNAMVAYPSEEIKQQLKFAQAKETQRGFLLVKDKGKTKNHKIDFVIADAMAVHGAIRNGGEASEIKKQYLLSRFADTTHVNHDWHMAKNIYKLPDPFVPVKR